MEGGGSSLARALFYQKRQKILRTSSHEIDRLQHLECPNLTCNDGPIEYSGLFRAVGPYATDEMRFSVDQSPQKVVQSRVEVLSQS